jgi:Transferrin.
MLIFSMFILLQAYVIAFCVQVLLVFAGDNSDKLCKLCVGKIPGEWCSSADPYFGFEGAFRCLVEAGDIAFLKHTTVDEMTSTKFDLSEKVLFYTLCTLFGKMIG